MTNTDTAAVQGQLNKSGALADALLATLDALETHALGTQPTDSKGKPTGTALYLHMTAGLPIDPKQFANPWTPAAGDTLASALNSGAQTNQPSSTPAPAPGAPPTTPAKPQIDKQLEASIGAAFATSLLVDELWEVTGDGVLEPYPTSRSLSFAYDSVIKGMQPLPAPPPSPDVMNAINAALAQLYVYDKDGNIVGKTPRYKNYLLNLTKWAQAKNDMAVAQSQAMADPVLGQTWPQQSATYQAAVDSAYDDLMAEGAGDIEQYLATVSSEGRDIQAAMVSQARQLYDAWNLGIAGVPSPVAYSFITPATWWDHTDEDIGFEGLKVSSSDYTANAAGGKSSYADNWYNGSGQSTSAGGSASFFGVSLSGSGSSSDNQTNTGGTADSHQRQEFQDESTSVDIELEWGLCRIERAWLVSDLFHMDGWYLVNAKKDTISDGTIEGQVKNPKQLLPMIPTAFLVVRNVKITADNWGQAGQAFANAYSDYQGHTDDSSSSEGGSVGFLGFGASASHSQYDYHGDAHNSSSDDWGWSFHKTGDAGTLTIDGSQIVGWIGEIVPACPAMDDPGLAKDDKGDASSSSSSSSGQSTTPSSSGQGTTPSSSGQGTSPSPSGQG
jgi:hypothetical protein